MWTASATTTTTATAATKDLDESGRRAVGGLALVRSESMAGG